MLIFHLKIFEKYRYLDASLKMAYPIWRSNFKKWSELDEIVRTQISSVAEFKSAIEFPKFKMADLIWRPDIRKTSEKFDEIVHYYVLGSLIRICC